MPKRSPRSRDAMRWSRAAALHVFEDEPLALDSPLRTLAHAIVTPHVAGFGSHATHLRLAFIVTDNIARFAWGGKLTSMIAPELLRPMT